MAAAPQHIILILLVIKGRSFNSSVSIQVPEVAVKYAYNILMLLHFQACAHSRNINLQYHKVDQKIRRFEIKKNHLITC